MGQKIPLLLAFSSLQPLSLSSPKNRAKHRTGGSGGGNNQALQGLTRLSSISGDWLGSVRPVGDTPAPPGPGPPESPVRPKTSFLNAAAAGQTFLVS